MKVKDLIGKESVIKLMKELINYFTLEPEKYFVER